MYRFILHFIHYRLYRTGKVMFTFTWFWQFWKTDFAERLVCMGQNSQCWVHPCNQLFKIGIKPRQTSVLRSNGKDIRNWIDGWLDEWSMVTNIDWKLRQGWGLKLETNLYKQMVHLKLSKHRILSRARMVWNCQYYLKKI